MSTATRQRKIQNDNLIIDFIFWVFIFDFYFFDMSILKWLFYFGFFIFGF